MGVLIVYPGEERCLAFRHELYGFFGQLGSLVVFMINLHLERTECLLVTWMLIVVAQAYFVERIPNFAQLIVGEEMVFAEHPGPIAALLLSRYDVGNTRINGGPVVSATVFAYVGTGGETYTAGSTKRRLTVAILETHAFKAESIDIFGSDSRVPIAA